MGATGCRLDRCGTIQVPANSRIARMATVAVSDAPGAMSNPSAAQRSLRGMARFKTPFSMTHDRSTNEVPLNEQLFEAARAGAYQDVVKAVSHGADINSKSSRGMTALMLAAGSNSKSALDTVRFLLEAMSAMEEKDMSGWSAFLHACRNSQTQIVEHLIESSCSLKVKSNDSRSGAMLATMDNADSLVQDLLNRRIDMGKRDNNGWSVMFYACEHQRVDLVRWLIKRNASVKDKTRDGTSCLSLVASNGSVKIASMLTKFKANVNTRDSNGCTALVIALTSRQTAIADFLLEQGADVTIKNSDDQDAAEIAEHMGMLAMKQKIESKLRKNLDDEGNPI